MKSYQRNSPMFSRQSKRLKAQKQFSSAIVSLCIPFSGSHSFFWKPLFLLISWYSKITESQLLDIYIRHVQKLENFKECGKQPSRDAHPK